MTDNPHVAIAGPLPPLLLNSSTVDVQFCYVFDAAGNKVEPARFKCSQIRGLTMIRLLMPQLRAFCMSMDNHGIQVMIATTIKAIAIKNIKVDILCTFCVKFGIKPLKKSKDVLAREIAYSKQMDGALELTGLEAKQSSQQRIAMAMKIRLLNACFTDLQFSKHQ
jgi:hypothetical protein